MRGLNWVTYDLIEGLDKEQACMFPKYRLIKDNKNELLLSQLFPI